MPSTEYVAYRQLYTCYTLVQAVYTVCVVIPENCACIHTRIYSGMSYKKCICQFNVQLILHELRLWLTAFRIDWFRIKCRTLNWIVIIGNCIIKLLKVSESFGCFRTEEMSIISSKEEEERETLNVVRNMGKFTCRFQLGLLEGTVLSIWIA